MDSERTPGRDYLNTEEWTQKFSHLVKANEFQACQHGNGVFLDAKSHLRVRSRTLGNMICNEKIGQIDMNSQNNQDQNKIKDYEASKADLETKDKEYLAPEACKKEQDPQEAVPDPVPECTVLRRPIKRKFDKVHLPKVEKRKPTQPKPFSVYYKPTKASSRRQIDNLNR